MAKIFVSYRRADSRKDAGRLYDRLVEAFGKDNVFKDIDSIPFGRDFRRILAEAVGNCQVLLAVIGAQWLNVKDEAGNYRLHNPDDFVRIEVRTALQRDTCLVVPVLVDGTSMPKAKDLPDDLRELAFKNGISVRDDPDFHGDVSRLIASLGVDLGITSSTMYKTPQLTTYNVHQAIARFYEAFGSQDWEVARKILAEIRNSGRSPRVFNVDSHEQAVWDAILLHEREQDYNILRLMADTGIVAQLWAGLQIFWETYPNYDPDNLNRFKPIKNTQTEIDRSIQLQQTYISEDNKTQAIPTPITIVENTQIREANINDTQPINSVIATAFLRIHNSPDLTMNGKILPIFASPFLIGRTGPRSNSVNFDGDKNISRAHAEISLSNNEWVLIDNGSALGTTVNRGEKISRSVILQEGDVITIGGTTSLIFTRKG